MAGWLVEWSLRNRFLVIVLAVLLIAAGVEHMLRLPIDAVPDVTNVQVQGLTTAPALAPLEVERLITFPVESAIAGLPDIDEIRSVSKFGLSAVTVVFEEGTDIYRARQLVGHEPVEDRSQLHGRVTIVSVWTVRCAGRLTTHLELVDLTQTRRDRAHVGRPIAGRDCLAGFTQSLLHQVEDELLAA